MPSLYIKLGLIPRIKRKPGRFDTPEKEKEIPQTIQTESAELFPKRNSKYWYQKGE
jgi:hypothetical protein